MAGGEATCPVCHGQFESNRGYVYGRPIHPMENFRRYGQEVCSMPCLSAQVTVWAAELARRVATELARHPKPRQRLGRR